MKVLLIAINAKYIHSNLAVYSLQAYTQAYCRSRGITVEIAEYTINQPLDEVLQDLYKRKADLLGFSCYIWNRRQVAELIAEYKKVAPAARIFAGGPEVSYDAPAVLAAWPALELVVCGEGEATLLDLLRAIQEGREVGSLPGVARRNGAEIVQNPPREILDLNQVPFVYRELTGFVNKIIYYESSRGCPYACSYCLSSVDKRLRLRDLETVQAELQFFLDAKVPQVKFVDRTFNCVPERAAAIWQYLNEHDNGVTNFHFEVAADLLNAEQLAVLQQLRPGLIQLEIGVQSTNPQTLKEIRRTMDFAKVAAVVESLKEQHNMHLHLDLIAGLPEEDISSFRRSFDAVYALGPHQLQLGFLKVLQGSYMAENQAAYGLVHKEQPPYEVLQTRWLSYDEVLLLKGVEQLVEVYYNSGQYRRTLAALLPAGPSAFAFYEQLSRFYTARRYPAAAHKRERQYEILLEYIESRQPERTEEIRELLTLDYYLRENAKSRPAFAPPYRLEKAAVREFYETEAATRRYLPEYREYDHNQLRRLTHLERFERLGKTYLFDYRQRDLLTQEAKIVEVV